MMCTCDRTADYLGRRRAMASECVVFIVGVIIQLCSFHVWQQFAVGRLVSGLAVGALSAAVPMVSDLSISKSSHASPLSLLLPVPSGDSPCTDSRNAYVNIYLLLGDCTLTMSLQRDLPAFHHVRYTCCMCASYLCTFYLETLTNSPFRLRFHSRAFGPGIWIMAHCGGYRHHMAINFGYWYLVHA
jgi:hypothetical protein